jgi:threonine dehydrogenase-like Zn-dependent dehydrogenase
VVSVIGVYAGLVDKFPMGSLMNRSVRMRTGQCHVHRYIPMLMEWILAGEIDPSFVITHRMALEEAPRAYRMFRDKQDDCETVVLTP